MLYNVCIEIYLSCVENDSVFHTCDAMFTVLDAFGKLPSGLAQGDLQWLGAYDECRSIKQTYIQRNVTETMQGKYCMTAIGTPKSVSLNQTIILKFYPLYLLSTIY